jgi:DNA-directed RNA polymerase subunit RPC12/RpoP
MPNTRLERLKGAVLLRSLYKCRRCQREQWGTGREGQVDVASLEELAGAVERWHPSPHDMPVGWSSHGAQGYQCVECNKENLKCLITPQ